MRCGSSSPALAPLSTLASSCCRVRLVREALLLLHPVRSRVRDWRNVIEISRSKRKRRIRQLASEHSP
eukprot:4444419-Pleurochrysis_carterae.AAC.1